MSKLPLCKPFQIVYPQRVKSKRCSTQARSDLTHKYQTRLKRLHTNELGIYPFANLFSLVYPQTVNTKRCFTQASLGLTHKYQTRLKRLHTNELGSYLFVSLFSRVPLRQKILKGALLRQAHALLSNNILGRKGFKLIDKAVALLQAFSPYFYPQRNTKRCSTQATSCLTHKYQTKLKRLTKG